MIVYDLLQFPPFRGGCGERRFDLNFMEHYLNSPANELPFLVVEDIKQDTKAAKFILFRLFNRCLAPHECEHRNKNKSNRRMYVPPVECFDLRYHPETIRQGGLMDKTFDLLPQISVVS